MGIKLIIRILTVSGLIFFIGCAESELYLKKEANGLNPEKILIGDFNVRNMNYDPYVADEFRDALKYAFFIKGYNVVLSSMKDGIAADDLEFAVKTCKENSCDILIKGCISQRESGFLADRETDTLISFKVLRKDGVIIGEGFFYDNMSAGEESLRRTAAEDFVSALVKKIGRAE